jgi:prefoldin subunit 5
MKKTIVGIIVCVALVCVALMFSTFGCDSNGVTPEQLQELAAHRDVLQQQVDTLQEAAAKMAEDLAAAEIVDPEVVAKVAEINEEADRLQAQIDVIAKALEGVDLTGDDLQDFVAMLQAGNAASTGFNPYAIPIGAGLTILNLFLGWLAKRNGDEAGRQKKKYAAHKLGVQRTMKEVSASDDEKVRAVETQLFDNIGEARSDIGV